MGKIKHGSEGLFSGVVNVVMGMRARTHTHTTTGKHLLQCLCSLVTIVKCFSTGTGILKVVFGRDLRSHLLQGVGLNINGTADGRGGGRAAAKSSIACSFGGHFVKYIESLVRCNCCCLHSCHCFVGAECEEGVGDDGQ